jgi:UDP-2,4-diacetamido-2,4,6-trideoxy-beta-L-altropyranose hydrolase
MRCLTLADTLKKQGASCTFISRHLPDYLQRLIECNGHKSILIGGHFQSEPSDELPHAHFLGTSQKQDADQTQTILVALDSDWLIIDHYGIDQRWESAQRPFTKKILVIDDLADRNHDCDLLIDQNLYADMSTRYVEHIPPSAKALLGVQYTMLRREFGKARPNAKARKGNVRRLFVFFGGMDSPNFTLPVLNALSALKLKGIEVDVVIGSEHPTRDAIQSICQQQNYTCHVQTNKMAELLLSADAAIGAGGSNSWERCCLGLPSLAFIVAPNQDALTLHAGRLGLLKAAHADIYDAKALHKEIKDFMNADAERELMSDACLEAIDAQGAQRIVDQMNLAEIELRAATKDDSARLFEWRNHPSIRAISINTDPIIWESHQQWFKNVLQDANRPLYIAEQAGTEVGVIRFDINEARAEVSLYLAPEHKGKGLGTQLLLLGEKQLLKERSDVQKLVATVREGNEASHRLFRRCDYQFGDSIYTKTIQA